MNSPNYPPPGGPQGPYGGQPPQGAPYGQPPRPPQTPPGGQPYGGPPPQGPPQGQPYGGPPPQGQPYGGAPGGPGGPGGPPPAGYPTPPPPAPVGKKSSTGTIIKIVVGVVVVGVIGVFAYLNWGTSPASSNVGDCIKVNDASASSPDLEKVECADPKAFYKVAVTSSDSASSCPDPEGGTSNYVSYTETGRGSDLLLCLTLNVKEGDCIVQGTQVDEIVPCTDPKATDKVIKIVTGSVDPAGCPPEVEDGYIYAEPKMVQCFGAVAAEGAGT